MAPDCINGKFKDHNQLIIIRLYDGCGRSDERHYGLDEVGISNKSLIIIRLYGACGRSNERPYGLDEVGIFNKSLIIIRLYDACGRSNERPYGLSAVRVFDDWTVGGHCKSGTETVPLLRPTI